ncbi:hypothetical protein [Streptomyces sp. Rer75]|uniref:hypothetical protein n=1 Tax=unclassified Streptomyces TaxID=2593676 RepID=UPI0015CF8576|nr:hypothetical protein [Streptomyces sp. Rer75]QLH24975.1 hypothetical protein HYQ63_33615 [Streptomyces sp. Rer75]
MIDVILPALPERELTPVSEETPQAPALTGHITLGGPVSVPVTSELVAGDPELLAFVEAEAHTAVYHLLLCAVSCAQDAPEPALHTVNLDLTLSTDPEAAGPAAFGPVAWSMAPHQLTGTGDVSAPVRLGPRLALRDDSHAPPPGERVCLEARRELRSDPGWEIRRTGTVPIGGTYRLAMVVRAPRGTVSLAAVAVGATVREGHTLHRFRAEIAQPVRLADRECVAPGDR